MMGERINKSVLQRIMDMERMKNKKIAKREYEKKSIIYPKKGWTDSVSFRFERKKD